MRSEQLNSYITKFDATVTAVDNRADGTFVALSDSLFYPESGGQLADTGTLAGQPVLSVQLVDGVRWHEVAEAPSVGSTVRGVVDWATRYVHMQRHTAQHLVSEALLRSNPAFATVSVSLRGPDITIELEHEPTQAELAHTFAEANRVARENPPVFAFTVTQSELARYTLRRPAPNVGEVRLIAIGDYDLSACGGTHVKQLAEVLPLLLVKTERVRGDHTRIVFRAGEEAAQLGQFSSETLTSIANDLSTSREEVAPRVAQLGEEVQALQASVQQWHTQWASEVAAQYEPGVVAPALSEETAAALRGGWMHTGDAGFMDEHGYVFLQDRVKDMIISGGENVYSIEEENAVALHPAVAQCAVVGIPSERWGEAVHAFVVFKPGQEATAEDIMAHCKQHIAGYKCPRSVEFIEAMPLSGAGKILKRQLRAPYWEGHDRQVA